MAMGTSAPELVVNAMFGVIITKEGTHDVLLATSSALIFLIYISS